MSLILNKNTSNAKLYLAYLDLANYFGFFYASRNLKLIILLISVCINCTMTMLYYIRIILQRIILRIIQSYYFETK